MGKKILVATDFSELGRAAVSAALELAKALDAQVDVLHAFTMLGMADSGGYTAAQLQQFESNAQVDLSRAADAVASAGRLDASLLQPGEPAQQILRAAESRAADLIVLGSHGRRGLTRMVLGSTAEDVLRKAQVPVLVIKEARAPSFATIGVAVDLGEESARVVATGFELANALGAKAHLLHAYAPIVVPNEFGAGTIPYESLHEKARESLRDLASPYERTPTMGKCVVELGDPTSVILELAQQLKLDLIVLGTQAKQGFTRLVAGSVAESVLRQSTAPVLIAKHRRG
ncbi:MAG: universal stress protein [Polyangiales bacterium]